MHFYLDDWLLQRAHSHGLCPDNCSWLHSQPHSAPGRTDTPDRPFLFFRCNFDYFLTFIVKPNGINGMSFFSVNVPHNYKHQTCFKEHLISPKRLNAKCNIILDIFRISYTSWSSLTVLMSKLTHCMGVCVPLFLPYSVDDPRWFVHSATLHWNSFTRCWLFFTKWEEQSTFFEWHYYSYFCRPGANVLYANPVIINLRCMEWVNIHP